jgi:hypothetical protein
MKRDNIYIIRFAVRTDNKGNYNELKETFEMLAENLGDKEGLKFDDHVFNTHNLRSHLTFLEKCYEFLEMDWIFEVTVHSF